MEGVDVCEGEHELADWVFSVRAGLGFLLQRCQHFHSFAWLCVTLRPIHALGRMGFALRTGAGVAPCAKTTLTLQHMEPANMTPVLGWKQHAGPILSRPRPSEMNVLGPHRLILLIHAFTPARFGFPSSQTHFVTHEPAGSKPNKFTMLHFWLCLTDIGLLTMCAFDRDVHWRDSRDVEESEDQRYGVWMA